MSATSPPNSVRTVELYGGGVLVLSGPDDRVEITLYDAEGRGGECELNMLAAEEVQNALLDRILHIQARERARR